MRFAAAAACALVTLAAFAGVAEPKTAATPESNVTIPLSRYEELRTSAESASATVVNRMTISGSFSAKNVAVTFEGRSVGTRTAATVLSDAPDLTLSGCTGEALLTRAGKGVYDLIALAPAFTLRCEARPSGSDRLRMTVSPSVLAVTSAVSDGELVASDEEASGARVYTLVRQVAGTGETLATTATGRYRITLLPDATRFRYVIEVHNPNRSTSPLPLQLVSGEHLQQIDSAASYEPKGTSYVFAMPPGDSTITLSGELQGTSFAPPVAASLQYVVIESHPLLRPAIGGAPKRVSAGETGIETQYRGPLAFEIGPKERIAWSVARLEAMRAISYAIRFTSHTLFIPASGPILGETSIAMDNQGAPELVLPQKPEPTFVSLGGDAVLMTKNARGELTVPLSAGTQEIVVQHRQAVGRGPLVFAQLDVPRLPVPSTDTTVQLRYPRHWVPLWQSFATQTRTWVPDGAPSLVMLLLALWLERALMFLAMPARRRIAAALLLAFAAMVVPVVLWLVVATCAFVTAVWVRSLREQISLVRILGVTAAVVVLAGLAFVFGISSRSESDYTPVEREGAAKVAVTETAVTDSASNASPEPAPMTVPRSDTTVAYQGLPAKFELPQGSQTYGFHEQLLSPERPQTITLVLLSMTLVTWTAIALALLAAWLLWRDRAAIQASLRARMA